MPNVRVERGKLARPQIKLRAPCLQSDPTTHGLDAHGSGDLVFLQRYALSQGDERDPKRSVLHERRGSATGFRCLRPLDQIVGILLQSEE